ncbi:MAG: hypothetical protein Q8942_00955 [Bacillota bacterium]|nr:hypothetical protein [Bacillota bacterium]
MSAVVRRFSKLKNKVLYLKDCKMEARIENIYLDGKLKEAGLVNEQDKSLGIFMHSLILSNSTDVDKYEIDEYKRKEEQLKNAVSKYTKSMGFDSRLIESIAPKLEGLDINHDNKFISSVHLINGKLRIVFRGSPELIIKNCSYMLMESKLVKFTRRIVRETNDALKKMISKGLNVYAIAVKDISTLPENYHQDYLESNLALVALVGVNKRLRMNY